MILATIILATLAVSLISLIGILFIFYQTKSPARLSRALISVAAGSLLAVSFLDLLPEAIETEIFSTQAIFIIVLASLMAFALLEKAFHWHHCRCDEPHHAAVSHAQPRRHLAYINLIGDAAHNLIDGVLIATAFMLNWSTGLVATVAVILHELPQEISDFGILLHAGLTRRQALLANLGVALVAVAAAVLFYFFSASLTWLVPAAAAFAAGNFIYLAVADLIPELDEETEPGRILVNSLGLVLGAGLIFALTTFLPG